MSFEVALRLAVQKNNNNNNNNNNILPTVRLSSAAAGILPTVRLSPAADGILPTVRLSSADVQPDTTYAAGKSDGVELELHTSCPASGPGEPEGQGTGGTTLLDVVPRVLHSASLGGGLRDLGNIEVPMRATSPFRLLALVAAGILHRTRLVPSLTSWSE